MTLWSDGKDGWLNAEGMQEITQRAAEKVQGLSPERVAEIWDVPREIVCPENCKHPAHQAERLRDDLTLYGNAYTVDGKRVPPESVVVHRQPTIRTQDELLTALDELLDAALHDDACYIGPNDTRCVCVIGKVRAAMPPCGAVRPYAGEPWTKGGVWKCARNAHPASPDRHVFEES